MSKESRLMKNTAIIAIGNICTKCISFFMLPLYTALMTIEQFGTVDLIITYSSLLVILMTLQFEQGIFRFLIDVRECLEKQKKYISTAFITLLPINVAFSIICVPILLSLNYQYTLYLVCLVVTGAFYGLALQIPRGLGNNSIYAISSCIGGSLTVFLNVVFIAILHWGVEGMLLATTISNIVATLYVFLRIKIIHYINFEYIDKLTLRRLLNYSLPLIPYTMCWWVINASDRTVINIFLGTAANGIYAAAYKFPSLFSMITNIYQLAWTESAAENVADETRDVYYESTVNKSIRFYSSCNIGIIAVMPFVFQFLINSKFSEAYNYIPMLMTAALFHSVAALYGSVYFAFKETKKVAYTTILSAIINIGINVVLINVIGLYAAALSSVMAYLVIIIIRIKDLRRLVSIKIKTSYLCTEIIVYIIVLCGYYLRDWRIQLIALVMLIPYCVIQNKSTLLGLCSVMIKKIKK